jgi:hypothetical protein
MQSSSESKMSPPGLIVLLIVYLIIMLPVAHRLGGMIFICMAYGHETYFEQHVRVIKVRPLILSNGVKPTRALTVTHHALTSITLVLLWLPGVRPIRAIYERCTNRRRAGAQHLFAYDYRALDTAGQMREGTARAGSYGELYNLLRGKGLFPIAVNETHAVKTECVEKQVGPLPEKPVTPALSINGASEVVLVQDKARYHAPDEGSWVSGKLRVVARGKKLWLVFSRVQDSQGELDVIELEVESIVEAFAKGTIRRTLTIITKSSAEHAFRLHRGQMSLVLGILHWSQYTGSRSPGSTLY